MNRQDEPAADELTLDWSLRLADVPADGLIGSREADATELARLTRLVAGASEGTAAGISVDALACRYELEPTTFEEHPGRAGIAGRFHVTARLRQTCVVTLAPIETRVEEEFAQDYVEGGGGEAPGACDPEDPFAAEPPLGLADGRIVYGPLVYDYFVMGIDPNPRQPGAVFDETADAAGDAAPLSPFAVLKRLQRPE